MGVLQQKRRLVFLLVPAIVAATGLLFWFALANRSSPTVPPPIITYSTNTPSEETVTPTTYTWQGGGDDPKRIRMPSLGVDAFVQRLGVDQNKQIAVPTNINLAGWFVDGAKPGQPGLSIIAGHFDGQQGDAVFKKLNMLKAGDTFQVERGDGTAISFKVIQVTHTAIKDAASVLFSQDPKLKSQLNLVTCGGTFDEQAKTYDQRVIVAAAPQL